MKPTHKFRQFNIRGLRRWLGHIGNDVVTRLADVSAELAKERSAAWGALDDDTAAVALIRRATYETGRFEPVEGPVGGFFRLSLPDEECGGESRLAALRPPPPPCHQHGPGGREQNENTAISARHGLPRGAGADELAHQ